MTVLDMILIRLLSPLRVACISDRSSGAKARIAESKIARNVYNVIYIKKTNGT